MLRFVIYVCNHHGELHVAAPAAPTSYNYLGNERCDVGRNSKYLDESSFGYVRCNIHEAERKTRALG